MARIRSFAFFSCLALPGCAPEFDRPSEVDSVRVLAVKKNTPYARPGASVDFSILDHDGSNSGRTLKRFWLGGCENPPGDAYAGCFAQFAELAEEDPGALAKLLEAAEGEDSGTRYTLPISDDIITRRPPPASPAQPRYGVAFVFFAVCAGEIQLVPPGDEPAFPLACFSPSGERLGQDHFVAGYSSVFVYDDLDNSNPRFVRFEVEGRRIEEDCRGDACVPREAVPTPTDAGAASGDGGPSDAGGDAASVDAGAFRDSGAPPAPPAGPPPLGDDCALSDPRCILVCERDEEENCPETDIRALVDQRSVERDAVLEATNEGSDVGEQMWINYYVDRGSLSAPVKLVSDATTGWNEDHGTGLRAPKEPGPVLVWGVVHDNRGGTEWIRASFYARRP